MFYLTQFMVKLKLRSGLVIMALVAVVVILLLQLIGDSQSNFTIIFTNIFTALLASALASIYFEYTIRKDAQKELMEMLKIRNSVEESGMTEYYEKFNDINFKKYFDTSRKVDMYLNFGTTLFNSIHDKIETFLSRKEAEINIYILHEDNKFIDGLGEHWGHDNPRYDKQGIIDKIKDTKETLSQIKKHLEQAQNMKGKIRVFQIKRHPVFYSFYRFDDIIIYCPSKNAESKSIVPFAFTVRKTENEKGIYKRCLLELESISNDKDSLELYYEN